MKVIYLNDWISGSWQVQKIHAQEFIHAFKNMKGIEILTYPKIAGPDIKSKTVNQKINVVNIAKVILKEFMPNPIRYKISKFLKNKKLANIKKEINNYNPDIILVRHNLSYFAIIEDLLKFKLPVIMEVNNLIQNDADLLNLPVKKKIFEKEQEIFNKAEALCCVSHNIAKTIKMMGIDYKKIFVTPNGVDPQKFFSHKKSDKLCKQYNLGKKIVIGYVGGFVNDKTEGRDVIGLLKAFQITKKKENFDIMLLMVGRMDKDYLNQTINKLGIENFVTFTGFIEHEKLPNIMNLIDIAVAPYFEKRLKDSSPLKLFEYMAMEKPVIIPGVGQVSEIIDNMESGVLVEADNVLSMADALSMLIKNDNLREKIGNNARSLIKKKYTWEHNAMKIAEVCRLVLKSKTLQ